MGGPTLPPAGLRAKRLDAAPGSDQASRVRLTRTRFAIALACSLSLAGTATIVLHAPPADAAKVRKKPPLQPLAQPRDVLVDAGADGPSPVPSVSPLGSSQGPAAPAATAPTRATTGLRCIYGLAHDPTTNKSRCLAPEELSPPRLVIVNSRPLAEQLGLLDQASPLLLPDGGVPGAGDADGGEADDALDSKARVVRVSFENGAVGGALRSLRNRRSLMAKCVEDHGPLRADSARLNLLFFVRQDQKASGIIVASARNIPPAVVRCIKGVVLEGTIGRPSTNPVGVKALIELKQPPP